MSYKNAMAGLELGGGKAVIIGESRRKTPELFEAFGRFVESLGGRYVTAEDVGTTTADMAQVARVTRYVAGLGRAPGEAGGDPGPKTALGVFLGIKAAVKFRLGRSRSCGRLGGRPGRGRRRLSPVRPARRRRRAAERRGRATRRIAARVR